jgi:site-specific recombinase XerD
MAHSVHTVSARDKLKPRREPYWHRLAKGAYLGYRKMSAATDGVWVARAQDEGTTAKHYYSLGGFSDLPDHQRFDAASKAAQKWFAHLGRGGSTATMTVRKACDEYVKHVRAIKGDKAAEDLDARFRRWVHDQPLASIDLSKLTRQKVEGWRKSLAVTLVKVNRDSRETPLTRDRSPGSVNRDSTAIRAALNYAHDCGHVTSDMAWRVALRPTKNADGRRDVYLDRQQRRALIESAPADIATFLRGLSLLPLRPGALAALKAGQYDKRLSTIIIGSDKAGKDRRIKLPANTAALFAELAKDKLPTAPLFARADGKEWDKDAWKGPIKDAALAAKLPAATTAYALRHSAITDLVTGGLDTMTVAQLSGTSIVMIERHYGHLRADHAAQALAALTL